MAEAQRRRWGSSTKDVHEATGSFKRSTVRAVGSETILLVEDEDAVRQITSRLLRSRGYAVLEAADGLEALKVCDRHAGAIDLLITDVMMPRMNGRDLGQRLELRADVIVHHVGAQQPERREDVQRLLEDDQRQERERQRQRQRQQNRDRVQPRLELRRQDEVHEDEAQREGEQEDYLWGV